MAWPSSLCSFPHFLQNFVSSSGTSILLRTSHIAHCDGSRILTVAPQSAQTVLGVLALERFARSRRAKASSTSSMIALLLS